MSIFIADTSTQGTGVITDATLFYPSITNPNIKMRTNCGIYNSSDNVIKFFTNGTDALTITSDQKVICNGSLITNINYNHIGNPPDLSVYATTANLTTQLATKQNTLTASTPLVGIGSAITNLNYNHITNPPNLSQYATITNLSTTSNDCYLASSNNAFRSASNYTYTTSNILVNYNNLINKPDLSSYLTRQQTSNIFITSNILSNTSNNLFSSFSTINVDLSSYLTRQQTSNIFITSNILSNTSNNLYSSFSTINVDLSSYLTRQQTSNIFITSNILSNTSNNLYSSFSTINVDLSSYLTRQQTSNIFITSNILNNTSNSLFSSITTRSIDLSSYFTKQETSNIFITSNILNNTSNFLINYNNLINKPTITQADWNTLANKPNLATVAVTGSYNDLTNKPNLSSLVNYWAVDGTATLYANVGDSSVRIGEIYSGQTGKFMVGGNVLINDGDLVINATNPSTQVKIKLTDQTTGSGNTDGFQIIKTTGQNVLLYNYESTPIIFGNGILQSMRIFGSGVGIGEINPACRLHLHENSANTECRLQLTDTTTGTTVFDGFQLIKDENQDGRVWNYENKSLLLGTTNTERVRINNIGNVGIGLSPNYKLDVSGDINFTGNLRQNGTIINLTQTPSYWDLNGTNINNNNTGNVGIGKVPSYKLDINGDINFSGNLRQNGTIINFNQPATQWSTSGTSIFYNTGFVGVGVNPSYTFDCYGNTVAFRSTSETTNFTMFLGTQFNSSAPFKTAIIAEALSSWSRANLRFCLNSGFNANQVTTADTRLLITNTGLVGVQNTVPRAPFSLGNSAVLNSDGWIMIGKNNGSGGTRNFRFGYDNNFRATIGDNGSNNNDSTWVVQFQIDWQAPNFACFINVFGNLIISGYLSQGSDQKLKTNIKTIENALWKVQQLRGVEYTHIIEGTRNIGLIAQEVENIIPEVVEENNGTKGISYANLVSVLINAIKEQQEIIDNQQNQLDASASAINNIMNILERNNIK